MTFAAVLDTSAVVAYASGSVHVGELLQELGDEGSLAVVPVVCLIEALTGGAGEDHLRLLAKHPSIRVVELEGSDWVRLSAGVMLLGALGLACSALIAVDGAALYVATCVPDVYGDGIETVAIED